MSKNKNWLLSGNSRRYYLLSLYFLASLTALTILPFIILCFFNNPSADDYSVVFPVLERGFLNANKYWYFEWTGRFFSSFLICLFNPLIYHSFIGYKILSLFMVIAMPLALFRLLFYFTKTYAFHERIVLGSLMVLFYFGYIPIVSEGFYWMSASLTYLSPDLLLVPFIPLLYSVYQHGFSKENKLQVVSFLILGIALIGCNEFFMLSILLFISLLIALFYFNERKVHWGLVISLVFFIGAALIVILCPGNKIRTAVMYSNAATNRIHDLQFSFILSFKYALFYCKSLIIPTLLFSIPVYLIIVRNMKRTKGVLKSRFSIAMNPILAILLFFLYIVLISFPSAWATGLIPVKRAMNSVFFIYLLLFLYILYMIALYTHVHISGIILRKYYLVFVASVFMVSLVMANSRNIKDVYKEILNGSAYSFNEEWNNRYQQFNSMSNQDTCYIPILKGRPTTLLVFDLSDNPKSYFNRDAAKYFKLKAIVATERK
jgi:hypothetical protein